uniref:Palladin n=1 Tax=Iconisemion striatum TaxID=60296 RepID=A0A1A7WJI6_9TELE
MQDGSWNQPLPMSVPLKDAAAGGTLEGDGGVFSEASSDGELYLDSATELDSGDGNFADLSAFLTADEINHSLDLAREAFGDEGEQPDSSSLTQPEQVLQSVTSLPVPPQTNENLNTSPNLLQNKHPCPDENKTISSHQNTSTSKPVQVSRDAPPPIEKVVRHKPVQPVYKQDRPRLVHEGLELNDRAASATEFCSRAATFIEELSSIFKGSAHLEQQLEEESSSPDSGYLSPRSQRPVLQGPASAPTLPAGQQDDAQSSQPDMGLRSEGPAGQADSERQSLSGAPATCGPLSPPQFLQKLKSQEVAEGCPIRLECRVQGNPLPLVRWFCEGRELQNSPDIQIWRDGDLHTLELENSTTMQASTFNYARPKQFIAAQSPGGAAYVTHSSGSSGSSLSSPISPPTSHKPFSRVALPPFTKAGSVESPSSPSFPPPPPPFLSSSNLSSPTGPAQDFPPPPPPPLSMSPVLSDVSSPFSSVPPSPASSFLSSVLPSTPPTPGSPAVNSLGLPKGNGTVKAFPRKSSVTKTPRIVSDSDIQGSKDAVIQDLERKLRFKEERISNGQQEYKVSSFEQRLISEIEFRLERSPVEESDDDVQHDEDSAGRGVAPSFDQKLKHYKVFEGMPVTFSCKIKGDPKPKVYWFKDGKQISKRSEHYRISRDPDGTCFLHTAAASLDDDGNYTILAANPDGRVSCTGRMMVQAVNQRGRSPRMAPGHMRRSRSRSRDSGDENDNIQERHFRPHFLQAPGDLIVQEGRLCRMDCKVSGLPTPDLVWQLNGQTIRPDSAHKMLVRENGVHSLVIEPVTNRDAGIYTCIASNRAGQNSFNLELIVAAKEMHKAPSFIEKLQNTSVAEGHPVRLECRVAGVPHPQIFWKRENESYTHNTDRISMHQDNCGYLCMIIQPALKEDAGWYTVSAKNEAGIISSTARLDVHAQWQQPNLPKPKKVRPSTSRYAALTERGLDVKAAFFPDSSPLQPGGLVESEDL